VDDIDPGLVGKIPPDGPRRGLTDIRGPRQGADQGDRILPFQDHRYHRTGNSIVQEFFIKILAPVFPIVGFRQGPVQPEELQGNDPEALPLKAAYHFPGDAALENAGLQ
jgi:hypothetical protein